VNNERLIEDKNSSGDPLVMIFTNRSNKV